MPRGEVVKDDSRSRSTVRQRHKSTVAKVVDVIARLPGRVRQTSDAVSAYTPTPKRRHAANIDDHFLSPDVLLVVYVQHVTNGQRIDE